MMKERAFAARNQGGKKSPAVGTPGGTALMVTFAVLCLTVFAILALSTVLADRRLSNQYAASTQAYYAADAEAESVIAELRRGGNPEGVERDGDSVSFLCPVSDTQSLLVRAEIRDGACGNVRKTLVYSADWEATGSLPVWQGKR